MNDYWKIQIDRLKDMKNKDLHSQQKAFKPYEGSLGDRGCYYSYIKAEIVERVGKKGK